MAKPKVKETPKQKPVIYAGPNTANGVLTKYTIFRGDIPDHIKLLGEKYEEFDKLFVAPAELVQFEQKAITVGTPQYRAYQNVLKGGNQ